MIELLSDLFPSVIIVIKAFWFIFSHGGWVVFVMVIVYILYQLYIDEIQTQYVQSIEWVFLEIKVPRENITSFYSVEQIFTQLHTLFDNYTFQEKYIEGKVVFWLSFEIVSLGGQISFIMRVPKKQLDLVEAAFYAQYPGAELNQVNDYLENFTFDPDNKAYELFGAEFVLTGDESVPIRTYKEFELFKSPDTDEKVVDPLGPLFESFSRINPDEFYGLQFLIRPAMDGSWKDKAEAVIKKLQGDKDFVTLPDVIKERITAVQRKIGKSGFQTKIRLLHIGAAESFNKNAKKLLLSPAKLFGSINGNSFRPAFSTKLDYRVSPTLEAPYINYYVRQRKIHLFESYKARSMWIGTPAYILNTEELATIWHLPTTIDVKVPVAKTLEIKKVQPPPNLPV